MTLLFIWVLYEQVFNREDIGDIWATFKASFQKENLPYLFGALILVPLNWILETLKWSVLMERVEKLSFRRALKGVLAGVTFSIFTPNRIGEYGGRILVVSAAQNWKTVVATLVGSFSQLVALLGGGLLGLWFFAYHMLELKAIYMQGLAFFGLVLIGLMLFCYFNIRIFAGVFIKVKFLRKYLKHVLVLRHYKIKELAKALGFAACRYLVYSIQYLLILYFFGIKMPVLLGLAGVATVFVLQTSIPLPPLMGLFVRGEVALQVWGYFEGNELGILAATFSVWLINLILPALLGLFLIMDVNLMKTLGLDKKKAVPK